MAFHKTIYHLPFITLVLGQSSSLCFQGPYITIVVSLLWQFLNNLTQALILVANALPKMITFFTYMIWRKEGIEWQKNRIAMFFLYEVADLEGRFSMRSNLKSWFLGKFWIYIPLTFICTGVLISEPDKFRCQWCHKKALKT